jgi:hypothetical protein
MALWLWLWLLHGAMALYVGAALFGVIRFDLPH